ncbi:MAG TPA: PBP1A family penicillin-binding protein [Steroidobacteraceae bacterium]|nr:PBP1A family penicillin-binding protein [Steroidobacteraceae bacterium]
MTTRLNRRLLIAATVIVSLAGVVSLAFLSTYYYLKPTLPDVAVLRDVRLQVPLRVYSRDGRLLAQIGEQRRVPVAWDEIPTVVVHAVLAAEDDRFFEHPGVDWQGVLRALAVTAATMEVSQGGSTLTQQLVRTTLITKERQLRRKLREIFLALSLENELTKQEIFTLFVNTQFLGQRSYGFAAASETYFGKPLSGIDAAEAALLAGILQAPSRLNPAANPGRAAERRAYVLRRMRQLGYLDDGAWREAMAKPVTRELFGPRVLVDAPWVGEMVRLALLEKHGERIYTDGFQVVTTVDSRLQRAADVALRSAVLEYDRRHGFRGRAGQMELEGRDDASIALSLEEYPVVGGLLPAAVVEVGRLDATAVARTGKRYRLPFDGMRWAVRESRPAPNEPHDVVAAGDVVYILPSSAGDALLAQLPEVQGAFVALDPHDGAIVALSGGFDYQASKFNRVMQARRQPGSSFKPFIYSAALESGFTPASIVLDAPVVYEAPAPEDGIGLRPGAIEGDQQSEEDWRPVNDSRRFYGPTRLRDALARSRNLVTIRVMRQIGVGYARDYVTRFGLPKDHIPADLTAALGTAQLTPLEMANGFSVFANGGSQVTPYLVERVFGADGSVLEEAAPKLACGYCGGGASALAGNAPLAVAGDGDGVLRASDVGGGLLPPPDEERAPRAISEANAWIITDLLRDVIRRGTGQRARALGRGDIAGKTGTTNDGRDAWFSGFNPDLAATAWIGFDQERPLGAEEEGARTALPMWIYFMREALAGRPERRLPMPDGVVTARVAVDTGPLADASAPASEFEYFLADHLPPGVEGASGAGVQNVPPPQKYEEPIF